MAKITYETFITANTTYNPNQRKVWCAVLAWFGIKL